MSGEGVSRGSDILDVPATYEELVGDRGRITALLGATMRVASDAAARIEKSGWGSPELRQALDEGKIPPVAFGKLVWRGTPPSWSLYVLTAPLEEDRYDVDAYEVPESMGGAADVAVPVIEDAQVLGPDELGEGKLRRYNLIQGDREADPTVWAQAAWDAATAVQVWQQQGGAPGFQAS